ATPKLRTADDGKRTFRRSAMSRATSAPVRETLTFSRASSGRIRSEEDDMRLLLALAFGVGLIWAGQALADPCEAIPSDGPLPAYLSFGARFSGPVAFVIDG